MIAAVQLVLLAAMLLVACLAYRALLWMARRASVYGHKKGGENE